MGFPFASISIGGDELLAESIVHFIKEVHDAMSAPSDAITVTSSLLFVATTKCLFVRNSPRFTASQNSLYEIHIHVHFSHRLAFIP